MSAHTPGPWRFQDEYVRASCLDGDNAGNMIADPYVRATKDTRPGEMEANARLIAAAPEWDKVREAYAKVRP